MFCYITPAGESSLRLQHTFYRFPFRFDVERLRAEALSIPESCWCTHPGGFKGNSFLPLISSFGDVNDSYDAPMKPTRWLLDSPYFMQIFALFRTLHGRARLMRLEPGDGVPVHVDVDYYWRNRTRVHIPIITHPDVLFFCGGDSVHMAAGEAWTFDNWRPHRVINEDATRRIHLTFDTFGSNAFWSMARPYKMAAPEQLVPFDAGAQPSLTFESHPSDPVMSPAELDAELLRIAGDVTARAENDPESVMLVQSLTLTFRREWRDLWHAIGPSAENEPRFMELRARMADECRKLVSKDVRMASNGVEALRVIYSTLGATTKTSPRATVGSAGMTAKTPRFERPVFIVCAPRSGSTLLFETLAHNQTLWTLGGEGHGQVESIATLAPRLRGFDSNRLVREDLTPEVAAELRAKYAKGLQDAAGVSYAKRFEAPESVRFLEKTPKNALRIPFFKAMFPDAKFIFLYREPRSNISAIMEAWLSRNFVTYRELPGWSGNPWSMLLIPGWRDLVGRDLAEIAMRQWRDTNDIILRDLAAMPATDWCSTSYDEFVAAPERVLRRLCTFAGIPFDGALQAVANSALRPSRYTLTAPHPDKWRKNEDAIAAVIGEAHETIQRLETLMESGGGALNAAQ